MSTNFRNQAATGTPSASAEQRLKDLGIQLPSPPEPFGTYAEAVQTGNLLFLTGMLPTEGRAAKFIGRVGSELDVEAGRAAAHLAALNVLAVARKHLGSLDKVTRIVRLGGALGPSGGVREPCGAQRPRCRAEAFGIARQSDADRAARRVAGHFGRCPRSAESR